eukprot:4499893-Ditylum_brightwellii.AAC.1
MALVVGIGVSSGVLGIVIAHVATVEANCSLQTSLLVYMALVVGVSSVLLSWKRDGSSTWLLLS